MHEIVWGDPDKPEKKSGYPWIIAEEMVKSGDDLLRPDWCGNSPFKDNLLIKHCDWLNGELDKWLKTIGYTKEGNAYRVAKNTNRTIALFSHGGSSVAAISHLMNLPIPYAAYVMHPDFTSIIELEFGDEEGSLTMPRFDLVHDTKHIAALKNPESGKVLVL